MTDIIGLIKKHLNTRFRELQTVEVVIVDAVDLTTMKCSVRPKAKIDVRGSLQDFPTILNVPISFQKSGDSVLLIPPKVNDIGTVIFSKHALDTLLINRDTVEITIPRTFDINDCIYISGNYTEVEDIPSIAEGEMILHHESGSFIKFFANGNIEIKGNRVDINEL